MLNHAKRKVTRISFSMLTIIIFLNIFPIVFAEENQTIITEQLKCAFLNSNSEQKCSSYYKDKTFECSGTTACEISISAESGAKFSWKSTCGGYFENVIDGQNDVIEFKCEQVQVQPPQSQVQPPATTCIDNDGEDYYTKSYVKTESAEKWDSCSSDKQLEERICLDGHYDTVSYTCPYGCGDSACIKGTWTGLIRIELIENICEPCSSTKGVPCRCESVKILNGKVSLYDSTGNLISSKDTSSGIAEFSGLKEGRYTISLYADGYTPDKLEINVGPNIANQNTISLKKAGTSVGNIKITVQDRLTGGIITNAKVTIRDASGSSINSADTSSGTAIFYSLKEGIYIAVAIAPDYNQNKIEFKIIGSESDYLTIALESVQPQTTKPIPTVYWYRNAYWQCHDGYEEKQGGETSCKPAEVWRSYAVESCKSHCKEGKCSFNAFKFYNECPGSSIVEPSVCGNVICESGEGEICEVEAIACEEGKKCEIPSKPAKCYYGCEQDCKKTKTIYARLEEKFKMQMSQEVKFSDYPPLEIKFNNFFLPECALPMPTTPAPSKTPGSSESPLPEGYASVSKPWYIKKWLILADEKDLATVFFQLENNADEELTLQSISIKNTGVAVCTDYTVPVSVSANGIINVVALNCTNVPIGTIFKGDIAITYRKSGGDIDLTSTGTISGKVVSIESTKTATTKIAPSRIEKYSSITGEVVQLITGRGSAETSESSLPTHSTTTACKEVEPYAVLQIKLENPEVNYVYTEVIKMKLGEKKKISDAYSHSFVISFIDYDAASKTGVFLVSKNVAGFSCPINCVCDLSGNVTECRKIEKCPEKTMLCPDGICKEKCEITNITTECRFGCFYQDKCLPYGLRVKGLYCSINNDMKTQLEAEEICENNFECKTNLCINDKCISSGLIQKIIDWFKNIFGL